ncbi:MAG: CPBP family intramembrane metalloprotease [Myxococcales bacterium]|nr:CPBP family intramembrane metalloprotease [Myxococcales bacterium]
MARTLLLLYAALAGGTVVMALAFGGTLGALVQPRTPAFFPALDLGLGLAVGLAVVLLGRVLDRVAAARNLNLYLRELLAPIEPRHALGIAVLGSLAEELLFRGFLQPYLGLGVTAVVFGVVHHVPRRRDLLLWPLAATLMGLVFGGLYELRGGILAPTVAHITINYFNLHYLLAPREA